MRTAKGTQATVVRVWPSMVNRGLWVVGFLSGLGITLAAAISGNLVAAPLGLLVIFLTARVIGWVEIHDGQLANRHLTTGSQIVDFSAIREVGLGMHQVGNSKWWYPEIATTEGNSVKLLALKSFSGTETIARVEEIFAACVAYMPKKEEDQFRTVTQSEDGELEFELSPGYDAYLREQANSDDEVAPAAIPAPVVQSPTPSQPPIAARQPHLTLVERNKTKGPDEQAPEVFTPQPLVDRRSQNTPSLTVVTNEFIERAVNPAKFVAGPEHAPEALERNQRPWQKAAIALLASQGSSKVSKMPAVVIESPGTATAAEGESEPKFTSLFRRSA